MARDRDAAGEIPPKSANQIDENLRRVYQDMLDPDVPPRFRELIQQLREQGDRS